jgi:hypothetical protein
MDMDFNRLPVKTLKVSDALVLKISQTLEKDSLYLTIVYLGGKFTLEKVFKNNMLGRERLEDAVEFFSNEETIKNHFGL